MLHAYAHPIRVFEPDEGFMTVIGANRAAIVDEVGVIDEVAAPLIVHATKARAEFLR